MKTGRIAHALSRARGTPLEDDLRRYGSIVRAIRSYDFSSESDDSLGGRARSMRARITAGAAPLGGLLVIGTGRHESRRIDDQLRGGAGRQGDPGSSRFFLSLQGPLFQRYGVPAFFPRGVALDDPRVLREIDRAQSIIEAQNHATRRTLRKYMKLVELDRRAVRELRDDALLSGKLPERVEAACPSGSARPHLVSAYLCLLDAFWADHLLLGEEVREGIDLERFAGREPGLEYIHRVGSAFEAGLLGIEEKLVDAVARLAEDPHALNGNSLGVSRPSSTWTYQVDDEAPLRAGVLLAGGGIAGAIAAGPLLLLQSLLQGLRRLREPAAPPPRRQRRAQAGRHPAHG